MTVELQSIVHLINAGQYEKAVMAVRNAKVGAVQSGDKLIWTKYFMLEAVAYFENGQFKEAYQAVRDLYDPLLHFAPVWLEPYVVDILLITKDTERALPYIERHLAHNPPDADILYMKACVLFKRKEYALARDTLEDALRLEHRRVDSNLLLVECLKRCRRFGRAMHVAQLAWEQGAAFAITQMIRLVFVRKGSCVMCKGEASCCKSPRLVEGSQIVRSKWQHDSMCFQDPRVAVWRPVASNADGDWIFNCPVLSSESKCTRYRKRPHVCRSFPEDPVSASRHPSCSYRFKIRKGVPKFSSSKALAAVCRTLKENECLEELAALEAHSM